MDECAGGGGGGGGEGVTFDRALGNYPHYFGIAFTNPKSGPDADNCSIEKVWIILVPFLRPNNADIIRIIEFVNGVSCIWKVKVNDIARYMCLVLREKKKS